MRNIITHIMIGIFLALPLAVQAQETAPKSKEPLAPLCFKTTKVCIERKLPASATTTSATPLDIQLSSADLSQLMSQVQPRPQEERDTVEVTGEPERGPYVPGGLASLYWALKNPKQVWRIFTPIT